MAKKKCEYCGRQTDLSNRLEHEPGDISLTLTVEKDGKPLQLCRECLEQLLFEWGQEVWECARRNENRFYILTAISRALSEQYEAKEKLERLIARYELLAKGGKK